MDYFKSCILTPVSSPYFCITVNILSLQAFKFFSFPIEYLASGLEVYGISTNEAIGATNPSSSLASLLNSKKYGALL